MDSAATVPPPHRTAPMLVAYVVWDTALGVLVVAIGGDDDNCGSRR